MKSCRNSVDLDEMSHFILKRLLKIYVKDFVKINYQQKLVWFKIKPKRHHINLEMDQWCSYFHKLFQNEINLCYSH